jgi:hypothetical protein
LGPWRPAMPGHLRMGAQCMVDFGIAIKILQRCKP